MQSALYSYQYCQAFKIIFKVILIAFASLAFCDTAKSETQLTKKDKLKAAYLLNFTRFIEWPNNSPEIPPAPIRICVEDSPEFLLFFNQMSANRKSGPLQQTVKAYLSNTVDGCELLYVKESSKDNFEKINASLTQTKFLFRAPPSLSMNKIKTCASKSTYNNLTQPMCRPVLNC
jgi:hypothetical protein